MAIQRIKKTSWLRRRFIESPPLKNLETWVDEAAVLKARIHNESTYQVVGDKTILRVNSHSGRVTVLIEVLGIPQINLPYIDLEPTETLICAVAESALDVDFLTLMDRADTLRSKITYSLESDFHIVLEGQNLTLHFFIQKDYIQADSR